MLLHVISGLIGATTGTAAEKKITLRTLAAEVREELLRAEELFNESEEDELIDSAIYRIKSLSAYQEYLLRIIREDEFGTPEGFIEEAVKPKSTREEGLAMG